MAQVRGPCGCGQELSRVMVFGRWAAGQADVRGVGAMLGKIDLLSRPYLRECPSQGSGARGWSGVGGRCRSMAQSRRDGGRAPLARRRARTKDASHRIAHPHRPERRSLRRNAESGGRHTRGRRTAAATGHASVRHQSAGIRRRGGTAIPGRRERVAVSHSGQRRCAILGSPTCWRTRCASWT